MQDFICIAALVLSVGYAIFAAAAVAAFAGDGRMNLAQLAITIFLFGATIGFAFLAGGAWS